jgi:hypothetical protein
MDQKSLCSNDGINNITCASIVGVGFFIRILLTWFAFALMRRSFRYGLGRFPNSGTLFAQVNVHSHTSDVCPYTRLTLSFISRSFGKPIFNDQRLVGAVVRTGVSQIQASLFSRQLVTVVHTSRYTRLTPIFPNHRSRFTSCKREPRRRGGGSGTVGV